jgi:hypothetical protein
MIRERTGQLRHRQPSPGKLADPGNTFFVNVHDDNAGIMDNGRKTHPLVGNERIESFDNPQMQIACHLQQRNDGQNYACDPP